MRPALLVFLLVFGIGASASTVTGVSCSATGAPSITGESICFTGRGAGNPSASATSTATVSLDFSRFTLNQTVNGVFAGAGFGGSSLASASGDISLNLNTSGPIRQGFVRIIYEPSWLTSPGDFQGLLNVTVGSIQTMCNVSPAQFCSFPLVPSSAAPANVFTLGQSFTLDIRQTTTAFGNFTRGSSLNSVTTRFLVQFIDSDGLTPLAVSEIPEPAAWTLIGTFFIAGLIARKLRVRY